MFPILILSSTVVLLAISLVVREIQHSRREDALLDRLLASHGHVPLRPIIEDNQGTVIPPKPKDLLRFRVQA